jgi:tellurite resistance protein
MSTPHEGLIYTMVLVAAADSKMTDDEMLAIGDMVRHLPVFSGYDETGLPGVAAECAELLSQEDGFDRAIDMIKGALPPHLRETAYALACDVTAADGSANQEELRLLEIIRHRLEIDRLIAAGIERGARARHMPIA